MALYPGTKAFAVLTVNSAYVAETNAHFLCQVNASSLLLNAKFKSFISSRANILIWDMQGLVIRPSRIILNLAGNELFIYFDGAVSTSSNLMYAICVSDSFTETDSASAFTNCGIGNYWGMEASALPVINFAGGPNFDTGTTWTTENGVFSKGIISSVSTDILTASTSIFANKTSFSYSVLFKPGIITGDNLFFSYRTTAGSIGFQIYYNPTIMNVYIGSSANYGQIANPLVSGSWRLISVVYNGSGESTNDTRLKLFINNQQKTFAGFAGTIPASIPSIAGAVIGHGIGGTSVASPVGTIDEQCVSDAVHTLGCITDRYNMFFNPSNFFTLGPAKTAGGRRNINIGIMESIDLF